MRSARDAILKAARLLSATAAAVLPVILFSRLLRAEGPLHILYGWTALCASFIFLSAAPAQKNGRRAPRRIVMFLAAAFGLAAVLTVLAQVNVARRSLAEAWLELARQGRAFGFFSFFASEIYAVFCLAQTLLLGARRHLAFVLCAAVTNSLCAGIILNRPFLLLLSLVFAFFLFLALGTGKRGDGFKARVLSVSPPAAAGFLLAAVLSLAAGRGENQARMFRTPDLSGLFVRLAPSFPLMRDVPGYGFSAGSGEMPASVYLSPRTLFAVRGAPFSLHYLASARYRDWNGAIWKEDPDEGEVLPYTRTDHPESDAYGTVAGGLCLELVDDFYSSVPTSRDTASALVSSLAPAAATFTRNRGIRFEPSARRGFVAVLLPGMPPAETTPPAVYASAGNPPSGRMAALARELRTRADAAGSGEEADRRYIAALLDHFSHGYRYSLETARRQKKSDTIEYFVFEGKQGFCLYFAGAFVLLAREGGLPARLAEGFRVELDEQGRGAISGNNAHAWPEVWIDGAWRIFEPTPPYAADDPFRYVRESDLSAKRQLEALFGRAPDPEEQRFSIERILPPAAIAFASVTMLAAAVRLLARKKGRLRREADRMVRRCRRLGVPGPEVSGWLEWGRHAERLLADGKKKGRAAEIAEEMIDLAFAPRGK